MPGQSSSLEANSSAGILPQKPLLHPSTTMQVRTDDGIDGMSLSVRNKCLIISTHRSQCLVHHKRLHGSQKRPDFFELSYYERRAPTCQDRLGAKHAREMSAVCFAPADSGWTGRAGRHCSRRPRQPSLQPARSMYFGTVRFTGLSLSW
jgi:hypothetical protein